MLGFHAWSSASLLLLALSALLWQVSGVSIRGDKRRVHSQPKTCLPPLQLIWSKDAPPPTDVGADALYAHVNLKKSAPFTLFVGAGFEGGSLGLQELSGPHERTLLFSLHDVPGGFAPAVLDLGIGAELKRWPFDILGLKGMGSHVYASLPWKDGESVGLLVTAELENATGAVVFTAHYRARPMGIYYGAHQITPVYPNSTEPEWQLLARLRRHATPGARSETALKDSTLSNPYSMAHVFSPVDCASVRNLEIQAPWWRRVNTQDWAEASIAEASCPTGGQSINQCPPEGASIVSIPSAQGPSFSLTLGSSIRSTGDGRPQLMSVARTGKASTVPSELSSGIVPGKWADSFAFRHGNDFFCYGKNQTQETAWTQKLANFTVQNLKLEKPACLPAGTLAWSAAAAENFDAGFFPTGVEWFYNEIEVESSAPFTFYMVAGFAGGYLGMQEHANGIKQIVFSLWDQGEPVSVLAQGSEVGIRRFHEELSGMQSILVFPWKLHETVRFLVHAEDVGNGRKAISAFVHLADQKAWKLLARYATKPCGPGNVLTKGYLGGFNSFMEIFNVMDCQGARRARYGPAWYRQAPQTQAANISNTTADVWHHFRSSRLSSTYPATGLDSGVEPKGGVILTASGGLRDSLHKPQGLDLPTNLALSESVPPVLRHALPTWDMSPADQDKVNAAMLATGTSELGLRFSGPDPFRPSPFSGK